MIKSMEYFQRKFYLSKVCKKCPYCGSDLDEIVNDKKFKIKLSRAMEKAEKSCKLLKESRIIEKDLLDTPMSV